MTFQNCIYQLKITLDDIKPPIWRRLQVPAHIPLVALHDIIQVSFGWSGDNLHHFLINDEYFSSTLEMDFLDDFSDNELEMDFLDDFSDNESDTDAWLDQFRLREGQKFTYEYDFGDSWEHTILLEKILAPEEGVQYPRCIKAIRACPPEDIGGAWAYMTLLETLADPHHPSREMYEGWVDDDFDPNMVDMDAINQSLGNIDFNDMDNTKDDLDEAQKQQIMREVSALRDQALKKLTDHQKQAFETLPFRQNMVAFLNYLKANNAKGTPATGNLQLKDVRAILKLMDETTPTLTEQTLTEIRKEEDSNYLYFMHHLAFQLGFIEGGKSRQWQVTSLGDQVLDSIPFGQVATILTGWLAQVEWYGIGYSIINLDQPEIRAAALTILLSLKDGGDISIKKFRQALLAEVAISIPNISADLQTALLDAAIAQEIFTPLVFMGIIDYHPFDKASVKKQSQKIHATNVGKLALNYSEQLLNILTGTV